VRKKGLFIINDRSWYPDLSNHTSYLQKDWRLFTVWWLFALVFCAVSVKFILKCNRVWFFKQCLVMSDCWFIPCCVAFSLNLALWTAWCGMCVVGTAVNRHLQGVHCRFANGDCSQRLAKGHTGGAETYLWGITICRCPQSLSNTALCVTSVMEFVL